jgi:hypothetical protein
MWAGAEASLAAILHRPPEAVPSVGRLEATGMRAIGNRRILAAVRDLELGATVPAAT